MKKIIFFLIIIISLLAINNLSHSIIDLWQKQSFLITAQQELQREENKNHQLQSQLKKVSQQQFVEEQARDKLLLVRPGEQAVLIPTGMLKLTKLPSTQSNEQRKPHWQEWWDLIFK